MREVNLKDYKAFRAALAKALEAGRKCQADAMAKRGALVREIAGGLDGAAADARLSAMLAAGQLELMRITSALEVAAMAFLGEGRAEGERPTDYLARICRVVEVSDVGDLAVMLEMQARNGMRYNPEPEKAGRKQEGAK
jgi:hypothetical protein